MEGYIALVFVGAYFGFLIWLPIWAGIVRRRVEAGGGPTGPMPFGKRLLGLFMFPLTVQLLFAVPVAIETPSAAFFAVCGIAPWVWMLFAYSRNPASVSHYDRHNPASVWWATGATFFALAFSYVYILADGLA